MIYVEEKYRVNVYLDTNILLDYIENVSGKRFGLLSRGALHKANRERFNLNRQ